MNILMCISKLGERTFWYIALYLLSIGTEGQPSYLVYRYSAHEMRWLTVEDRHAMSIHEINQRGHPRSDRDIGRDMHKLENCDE